MYRIAAYKGMSWEDPLKKIWSNILAQDSITKVLRKKTNRIYQWNIEV